MSKKHGLTAKQSQTDPEETLKSKVLTVCPKASSFSRLKFSLILGSWTLRHPEAGELTLFSGLHLQDHEDLLILPWLTGTGCFACLFVTAMHSLENQHPQLPHTWETDGRYVFPTFEKNARVAIQGELLRLGKSKTSSLPFKFSFLFYVFLAASVVWPVHDEKG